MDTIVGILSDIDDTLVRHGGAIDQRVAAVLRGVNRLGIPMGVATGKNADYARGLASGIGLSPWRYICAESGAEIMMLLDSGPPAVFAHRAGLNIGIDDLAHFRDLIGLDPLQRQFTLRRRDRPVNFRPELKGAILTLLPADHDFDQSVDWKAFFEDVIRNHELRLVIKRHKADGSIDVVPAGVNKGQGVVEVCRELRCEPHQILTAVDGENDDELVVGTTAIAVGNAIPRIRDLVRAQGGYLAKGENGIGFVEGLAHFARQGRFGDQSGEIIGLVEEQFPEERQLEA